VFKNGQVDDVEIFFCLRWRVGYGWKIIWI